MTHKETLINEMNVALDDLAAAMKECDDKIEFYESSISFNKERRSYLEMKFDVLSNLITQIKESK